jgi:predicted acyltransferase
VTLLTMGEVMPFAMVAKAYPKSSSSNILAFKQTDVQWSGMGLHDTIQQGFTLLVGVALPYSVSNPMKPRAELRNAAHAHAVARCAVGMVWHLAASSWIIDVKGFQKWSLPLVVVGMNSIAAYVIAHLRVKFIIKDLHITFGYKMFQVFCMGLEPLMVGIVVMLCYWATLYWMWRDRIFISI